MSWGEPRRARRSVFDESGTHVGFATVVDYPGRDITAFTEGTPYYELAVADLDERHVALFQRYKQHWLVHCGEDYDTSNVPAAISMEQVDRLAALALRLAGASAGYRLDVLTREVGLLLGGPGEA